MQLWVALFSQTGNELGEVIKKLGKHPHAIFCDKKRADWHPSIDPKAVSLIDHDSITRTLKCLPAHTFVSLHGYLRIIPNESIKEQMYNVHPGDIESFPQLKGIHPQRKALDLKLPSTGVVIHKVTDELDGGAIVSRRNYVIKSDETEMSLVNNLRDQAIDMWVDLLKRELK